MRLIALVVVVRHLLGRFGAVAHGAGDEGSDGLGHFDEVVVGKVGIARRRPMAPMPEQFAAQRQVLAGHHSLKFESPAPVGTMARSNGEYRTGPLSSTAIRRRHAGSRPSGIDRISISYSANAHQALSSWEAAVAPW